MIKQCFSIFGCLAVGEIIVWLTGASIPSSIFGMLLLTAAIVVCVGLILNGVLTALLTPYVLRMMGV